MIVINGQFQNVIKIKAAGGVFEISNKDLLKQEKKIQDSICKFIQNLNQINSPDWIQFGKLQILFFFIFLITIFVLAFNEIEEYQEVIMFVSLVPFCANLIIFILRICFWVYKVKKIFREYQAQIQDDYIMKQQDLLINCLLGDKSYPDLVILTIQSISVDFLTQEENSFSDISEDEQNDVVETKTNLEPLIKKYSQKKNKIRTQSNINFN